MKCGKCWGEGHSGFRCKSAIINPAALPKWADKAKQPSAKERSSFQELLQKPSPLAVSSMPAARPKRLEFFSKQDASTLEELARLERGVVFNTHGFEMGFSVEDVAGFATRTETVQRSEIAISILQRDRFLIILPEGLAPETFIKETSLSLWEAGFSFQPWSLMDEGSLVLPEFKVLLDLKGFPPHVYREDEIGRAVGTFGMFLGSVPQQNPADISCWTVAVAVDRLERVPVELAIHKLGSQSVASVFVRNWLRSPLYAADDLPKHKPKFTKLSLTNDRRKVDAPAPFVVSRKVLLEMCRGKELASLPSEIQEMLASIPNLPPDLLADQQSPALPSADTLVHDQLDLQLTRVDNPEAGQLMGSNSNLNPVVPHETTGPKSHEIQGVISAPRNVPNAEGAAGRSPRNKPTANEGSPQKIRILQRSPDGASALIHCRNQGTDPAVDSALKDAIVQIRKETGEHSKSTSTPQLARKPSQACASNSGHRSRDISLQRTKPKAQLPPKPAKFKISPIIRTRRAKAREAAQLASITKSQDGLVQVNVEYSHVAALGMGLGVQPEQVQQALSEDNQQRISDPNNNKDMDLDLDLEMEGPDLDFDLDSDDDLNTDVEEGL